MQNKIIKNKNLLYTGLIILISIAGLILMMILTSKWGAGIITYDSAIYINIARNLIEGNGISTSLSSQEILPNIKYPPMYSSLISFLSLFGVSVINGARLINSLLFGANIFLVGLIIIKYTKSIFASVFCTFIVLASVGMLKIHSAVLSEPLFIFLGFLGLFFLILYLQYNKINFLILSALLIALAFLTRYAGFPFVVAAVAGILFLNNINRKKRLLHSIVFTFISSGPMIIWMVRNYIVSNSLGREANFHPINLMHLKNVIHTFSEWVLPKGVPLVIVLITISIIILSIIFLIIILARKKVSFVNNENTNKFKYKIILLFCFFILIYIAFLFLSITFFDYQTPLDYRVLSPVFISFVIMITIVLTNVINSLKSKLIIKTFIFVLCAYIIGLYSYQGIQWGIMVYKNGQGYLGEYWSQSKIIEEVRKLPPSIPLYSNGPDTIYILTEKTATMIPARLNPNTNRANDNYINEINDMSHDLMNRNGVLIYFNSIERDYLMEEEEFINISKPYVSSSYGDGTMYKLFSENNLQNNILNLEYRIDKSNFNNYWNPLSQCEFAIKNDYVWIKTFGDDPYFESKFPLMVQDGDSMLMIVVLDILDETYYNHFQIFFGRTNIGYNEVDSVKYPVEKGENRLYIEIPFSNKLEKLRIDPINANIDCYIKEILIYNFKD